MIYSVRRGVQAWVNEFLETTSDKSELKIVVSKYRLYDCSDENLRGCLVFYKKTDSRTACKQAAIMWIDANSSLSQLEETSWHEAGHALGYTEKNLTIDLFYLSDE